MIDKFTGEYRWLSNFELCEVCFDGVMYASSEAAYQAAKTLDTHERDDIQAAKTPGQAKRLGQKVAMRKDWDSVKVNVMEEIVRNKFANNPDLKEKLLATGTQELVEGNTWGDKFWGKVDGVGKNHLGKILMKVRDELT